MDVASSLPPGVGKVRCIPTAGQESESIVPGSWGVDQGWAPASEVVDVWWPDVTGEPGKPSSEGTRLKLRGRENSGSRDPWPACWGNPGWALPSPALGRAGPSPCLSTKPWLLISNDQPWCIVDPHLAKIWQVGGPSGLVAGEGDLFFSPSPPHTLRSPGHFRGVST